MLSLLFAWPLTARAQTPEFSATFTTNATTSGGFAQITFSNGGNGLGTVTNASNLYIAFLSNSLGATATLPTTTGFRFPSAPAPTVVGGTNWYQALGLSTVGSNLQVLNLSFTPGGLAPGSSPQRVTNYCKIWATNAPGGTQGFIDFHIVIEPTAETPYPIFRSPTTNWVTASGTNVPAVTNVVNMRVALDPSNSPSFYPGADVTSATKVYALWLSNSLGQTNGLTNVQLPSSPGTNYLATSNLFGFVPPNSAGAYTNITEALSPASPWTGSPYSNNTNAMSISSGYQTNGSNWVAINFIPGTNNIPVTNYVQLLAVNSDNSSGSTNWTTNDLQIIVEPVAIAPPYLEIRFYNTSTNAEDEVYILPRSTDAFGSFGNGFWWFTNGNTGASNNYTNWITNGVATLRLSDIGISGTNNLGRPYYSVYTTNFPNAAWYLCYGGGSLSTNQLTNNKPAATGTNALWYGHEWGPFEITLAGNPADKCDMTYINEFSIPVTVRALTNDYISANLTNFPTNSVANLYQVCGFTNWTDPAAVAQSLTNIAAALSSAFPRAAITNTAGQTVMYAGPSAAPAGTLVAPLNTLNGTNPFPVTASNAFLTFSNYFAVVQANTGPGHPRTNKIKDSIGLAGATNAGLGTNPVFLFHYDFDLVVTNGKLVLTNGTVRATNQPGSTCITNLIVSDLWMEIGGDAGVNDNWASWTVYSAPTPANFVTNSGGTSPVTNITVYTPTASNAWSPTGLPGTPVFRSSTNKWIELATSTATVLSTNVPPTLIANPTGIEVYQSQFGTAVMGRILGDMAAGFALGFINSDAINAAYSNLPYGDSPSGSWWGGNEYPQANTVNSNAYNDVNTNYSVWGGAIYSNATKVTYGHPIYDRMQFYGGGNPSSPLQVQPASATNNTGPLGVPLPVWVVEVEFFNGLSSVGGAPPPPVYLTYSNWVAAWLLTGANTNTTADPDGDGFDNNKEYAFGGNPTNPTPHLVSIAGSNISYLGLNNANTNYTVQNTTNLSAGPWTNYAATVTNATNQLAIPLPAYYQRREFSVPVTAGTNNFYRVIFSNQ